MNMRRTRGRTEPDNRPEWAGQKTAGRRNRTAGTTSGMNRTDGQRQTDGPNNDVTTEPDGRNNIQNGPEAGQPVGTDRNTTNVAGQ